MTEAQVHHRQAADPSSAHNAEAFPWGNPREEAPSRDPRRLERERKHRRGLVLTEFCKGRIESSGGCVQGFDLDAQGSLHCGYGGSPSGSSTRIVCCCGSESGHRRGHRLPRVNWNVAPDLGVPNNGSLRSSRTSSDRCSSRARNPPWVIPQTKTALRWTQL